ncbi:MAG: hypothetical protein KC435_05440 [Thermomicrobiales bacterium]|nr:hypothetical protein [Thermomicrobiales bacterium]
MMMIFLTALLILPFFTTADIHATPTAFVCPVTAPSDVKPSAEENPFATDQTTYYEDGIWVTIPADGMLTLTHTDEVLVSKLQGWRSSTHTWMRADGVEGWIIVSGKRLDEASDLSPQTPLSPERQYVKVGYAKTGIAFPSGGCWEVTATVGGHSVTWVMDIRWTDDAGTPSAGFTCPVTHPNTSDLHGLPGYLGNGMVYHQDDLWLAIPADGTWTYDPAIYGHPENPAYAGWAGFKLHVYRGENAHGNVTVTGQRLDQDSDQQAVNDTSVDEYYGDSGFVPVALMIPSEGCWEFTITAGESTATWVMDVRFVSEVTPIP